MREMPSLVRLAALVALVAASTTVDQLTWMTGSVQTCPTDMAIVVKDCIYRFIRLSPLCRAFVDTPEFQRLREIKQLGPVHLVYPGAVHTRLEHSLGVMHLAGEVVDVLRRTGATVSDRERDLVQLAGLLHDVGHVAYSHMTDHLLRAAGHAGHEARSVELVERINARLGALTPDEVATVQRMIVGDADRAGDRAFLYEIVANRVCGVDVDRFDYLQRDAHHTGVSAGFQPDYVIQCLRVCDGRLCVLRKALPEVRGMYEARTRMFQLVYRHRTVVRIERTIREAVIPDLPAFMRWAQDNWLALDDVELLAQLRRHPGYARIYARQWSDYLDPGEPTETTGAQLDRVPFV
jgi:HD superfamily phosphohydrolase